MKNPDDHYFIGTGKTHAESNLPEVPSSMDYFNILKLIINDETIGSVGGNIQYGAFHGDFFTVYGVYELGDQVHYWRAALDLNSKDFIDGVGCIIPAFEFIDPFSSIGITN